jgi:hypothetical protein
MELTTAKAELLVYDIQSEDANWDIKILFSERSAQLQEQPATGTANGLKHGGSSP